VDDKHSYLTAGKDGRVNQLLKDWWHPERRNP